MPHAQRTRQVVLLPSVVDVLRDVVEEDVVGHALQQGGAQGAQATARDLKIAALMTERVRDR